MGLSFIADYNSERVCWWGVFLESVRPMGSILFDVFPFWVIFCHITLERSWVIGFVYIFVECTLPRQSSIANRVLHKRQRKLIDVIDRHVMIFLTTYFRTTPVADVNFTSLVTSLITYQRWVSFTVALVICKLQHILKRFMSLVAQRVFTSMMRIMQPANQGLACNILCCRRRADYFRLRLWMYERLMNTCMQYNHAIHICIALLWRHRIVYCITN